MRLILCLALALAGLAGSASAQSRKSFYKHKFNQADSRYLSRLKLLHQPRRQQTPPAPMASPIPVPTYTQLRMLGYDSLNTGWLIAHTVLRDYNAAGNPVSEYVLDFANPQDTVRKTLHYYDGLNMYLGFRTWSEGRLQEGIRLAYDAQNRLSAFVSMNANEIGAIDSSGSYYSGYEMDGSGRAVVYDTRFFDQITYISFGDTIRERTFARLRDSVEYPRANPYDHTSSMSVYDSLAGMWMHASRETIEFLDVENNILSLHIRYENLTGTEQLTYIAQMTEVDTLAWQGTQAAFEPQSGGPVLSSRSRITERHHPRLFPQGPLNSYQPNGWFTGPYFRFPEWGNDVYRREVYESANGFVHMNVQDDSVTFDASDRLTERIYGFYSTFDGADTGRTAGVPYYRLVIDPMPTGVLRPPVAQKVLLAPVGDHTLKAIGLPGGAWTMALNSVTGQQLSASAGDANGVFVYPAGLAGGCYVARFTSATGETRSARVVLGDR